MPATPTLKEKTAKGLFWGAISNGSVQLISMLFGIYMARILDVEDYGLVGMLAIFTAIANTIITSGFTVALTNKKEIRHDDYNAVFWFTTGVSLLVYILLYFSAPLIAAFYEKPVLIPVSRLLFLSFVFGGIASVPHTVLFKQLMVKQQARIDILSVILSGTAGLIMAFKGMGFWALVWQTVLYVMINSVVKIIVAPWKPTFHFDFSPLKQMFSFSVKLFLTNIVVQINNNIFTVILGKLFGDWQLGLYSQGNKWMMMCSNILTGMVNSVAHPVLVEIREDRERQLVVFRKMIRFSAFVAFPSLLGLAFIANEFILLSIGEKWMPGVPILQILCILGAIYPIWHLYTHVLITHGKSNLFLYGNIGQGVIQIISLLITARFGIYWMVVIYVSIYFLSLLYWHYFVHRLIGMRIIYLLKDVLPYLGIVVLVFAVVWGITLPLINPWLLLISKVLLSALFYCLVLWFSGSVIFRESIGMLFKSVNKKK